MFAANAALRAAITRAGRGSKARSEPAKHDLRLTRELRRLDRIECLILDDICYVQHDRAEMEVLLALLAERHERRSVMITSNLLFSQRDQNFKDPITTAAAIDRVVHHSVIQELDIANYRAEAAQKRTWPKQSDNAQKSENIKSGVPEIWESFNRRQKNEIVDAGQSRLGRGESRDADFIRRAARRVLRGVRDRGRQRLGLADARAALRRASIGARRRLRLTVC